MAWMMGAPHSVRRSALAAVGTGCRGHRLLWAWWCTRSGPPGSTHESTPRAGAPPTRQKRSLPDDRLAVKRQLGAQPRDLRPWVCGVSVAGVSVLQDAKLALQLLAMLRAAGRR